MSAKFHTCKLMYCPYCKLKKAISHLHYILHQFIKQGAQTSLHQMNVLLWDHSFAGVNTRVIATQISFLGFIYTSRLIFPPSFKFFLYLLPALGSIFYNSLHYRENLCPGPTPQVACVQLVMLILVISLTGAKHSADIKNSTVHMSNGCGGVSNQHSSDTAPMLLYAKFQNLPYVLLMTRWCRFNNNEISIKGYRRSVAGKHSHADIQYNCGIASAVLLLCNSFISKKLLASKLHVRQNMDKSLAYFCSTKGNRS